MTREEKCLLAIEKGFTYNPETGDVLGIRGKKITGKTQSGYIQINMMNDNKKLIHLRVHQFAWYCINKETVDYLDHINRIKTDNRISNLRSVTNQENTWNQKAKGYSWNKQKNKWISNISDNGKLIYLGSYNNEDDARQAYLQAKEKYHKING